MVTTEFFPSKFPSIFTFMSSFLTHQYLLGPYIAMTALLFLMIFYTHHIFMVLLFLKSPSLWIQRNFIITSWQLYCSVGIGRIVWYRSRLFHLRFQKYQICIKWYRRCSPGDPRFWYSDKCKVFSILDTRKFLQTRFADCLLLYSTLGAFNCTPNALVTSERGRLLHYIQLFVLHSFIRSTFS